jgi:hypothetical protein
MGGLSGHMMHPHDNLKLTIGQFKTLAFKSLAGQLPMAEKVDGFNIHILNNNGELRFARSGEDLKFGGFGRADIENRFANGRVKEVFLAGWDMVVKAGFWKDVPEFNVNHTTLNAEIVLRGVTNIMYYEQSEVIPHNIYTWENTGKWQVVCVEKVSASQDTFSYDGMPDNVIPRTFGYNLACERFAKLGMTDENTLEDYYKAEYALYMNKEWKRFIDADPKTMGLLFNRFFGVSEKINLREIRKAAKLGIQDILDNEKNIVWNTKKLLDIAVLSIGSQILDGAQGLNATTNTSYQAAGLIEKDINAAMFDPEVLMTEKEKFSMRWKYTGNKIYGMEGVVVEFEGNLYKWTGPFAPINQLLGGRNK